MPISKIPNQGSEQFCSSFANVRDLVEYDMERFSVPNKLPKCGD
jgi:hypothetical protein